MTKRELQQLRLVHSFAAYGAISDAVRIVGWFYGDALGKEYRKNPHVLCVNADGDPYLVSVEHYKFEGTKLMAFNNAISQVFVG